MIYTSSYIQMDLKKNLKKFKDQVISISGDRGREADYSGPYYSELAPKREFWDVWHSNIGKISEKENDQYYIRKYYETVLSKLDVNKVKKELDDKILLCYEYNTAFCHRHIVAAWFELYLGENVAEVKAEGTNLIEIPRRKYIKEFLNEVIKSQVDMKGFDNLYSLNLYNKGESLEKNAKTNNDIELAKYLKNLAFEHNNNNNQKHLNR